MEIETVKARPQTPKYFTKEMGSSTRQREQQ